MAKKKRATRSKPAATPFPVIRPAQEWRRKIKDDGIYQEIVLDHRLGAEGEPCDGREQIMGGSFADRLAIDEANVAGIVADEPDESPMKQDAIAAMFQIHSLRDWLRRNPDLENGPHPDQCTTQLDALRCAVSVGEYLERLHVRPFEPLVVSARACVDGGAIGGKNKAYTDEKKALLSAEYQPLVDAKIRQSPKLGYKAACERVGRAMTPQVSGSKIMDYTTNPRSKNNRTK